ncbi:predicted protein [Thalassiosira pseudonana CCMP1335]|uniref:Uncharacterized protein n=1 Tax=Thalassiosira pseudonana TaxID=35128 RepID=B8BSQ2_THAPS|nr:predicted protein [Thalassiosira pseudonana CCMP1335]EED96169.1 predicted protein [Thalassiosira pseudonana CCMP1335]
MKDTAAVLALTEKRDRRRRRFQRPHQPSSRFIPHVTSVMFTCFLAITASYRCNASPDDVSGIANKGWFGNPTSWRQQSLRWQRLTTFGDANPNDASLRSNNKYNFRSLRCGNRLLDTTTTIPLLRGGSIDTTSTTYFNNSRNSINANNNKDVTPSNQQQRQLPPSTASPYEYTPVTALDDYGQSTQLRYAMESAFRFGTPVVACLCCHEDGGEEGDDAADAVATPNDAPKRRRRENAIVVCSLQRPRLGVVSSSSNNGIINHKSSGRKSTKHHPSIQGMVRVLATRDDDTTHYATSSSQDNIQDNTSMPQHSLHTAIITTGLQSDAQFLLNQLQQHFISKYWFRYNVLPSSSSDATGGNGSNAMVVKMVRDILLDCMGYDWGEELGSSQVSGGIGSAAPSANDNEEDNGGSSRAGRPLGVCSFLLGLEATGTGKAEGNVPSLTVVEANGSSEQYVARAMGMGSRLANEQLSVKWKQCMSREESKQMMREILKEVAKEKGWMGTSDDEEDGGGKQSEGYAEDEDGNGSGLTLVCETVTSRGIEVEYLTV